MVASVYKYVTEEAHAVALIERGSVHLRSLADFRKYEDDLVRGDANDGELRYQPADGLKLAKLDGEAIEISAECGFTASVKADDIFVYCMSGRRSEELAAKFKSPFCVEIKDPGRFAGRIMSHVRLRSRMDGKRIYSRPVEYRSMESIPEADWALPERVAFMKPPGWSWQDEYRIVVGKKGALDVYNVDLSISAQRAQSPLTPAWSEPLALAIGNLSRMTELHRF